MSLDRYTQRLRREWLLGLAVATLVVVTLNLSQLWRPVGDLVYDGIQRTRTLQPHPDIVVIAIDDRSIAELGGWPLQRSLYTELLELLDQSQAHPRVVGINLLFIDPSAHDVQLAAALRLHRTVLPVGFWEQPAGFTQVVEPIEPIRSATSLGHINAVFSDDGSVRSMTTYDSGYTHFALEMWNRAQMETPRQTAERVATTLRLNIMSPAQPFTSYGLSDVLLGRAEPALLKDKYVLLGVTSPTLGDRFATLYSGRFNTNTPGVMILASALQAAMLNEFVQVAAAPWTLLFNAAGVWLVLLSLLYLSPLRAVVFSVGMLCVWLVGSWQLLQQLNMWVDPSSAMMVVVVFQALWAWRRTSAMARVVVRTSADLTRRSNGLERPAAPRGRHEFVVQHALMLDQVALDTRSELQLLSSVIEEMPEAVAIASDTKGLLLWNERFRQILQPRSLVGLGLQQVFADWGVQIGPNPSQDVHWVQLPSQHAMGLRQFMLKLGDIEMDTQGHLWVLVLSDVTQLRQVQAQRDQALQFLSHDMRTPLASILTLVRQPNMPAYKIEQHAQKLLQMMDDFCVTVAADAPSYTLQAELLDMLVDDALERVADLADAKHIALSHHNQAEAVFVQANAQLLVRAFTNLLQNAVKFAPLHSTVEVRVTWQAGAQPNEHRVRVLITNTVYATYQDNSLPGFGLGLAFVDKVVTKHGGQLVREIPPHGEARVTLELPCATADSQD